MKLGINVPYTDHIPREMVVAYVQEADRLGYDKVWVAEAYGWDAFTILAMLACSTQRIGLATGIVNVFSRSPTLIAQTAASLDAISDGRFNLGLGTSGHQVIEGWHGVKFEKGVRRLRETMEIVRTVLERTGRLIVVDTAWTNCGASAEIVARVAERLSGVRDLRLQRLGFAPVTCPTTPPLEELFYPNPRTIARRH